jgi:hypothetical protein
VVRIIAIPMGIAPLLVIVLSPLSQNSCRDDKESQSVFQSGATLFFASWKARPFIGESPMRMVEKHGSNGEMGIRRASKGRG